MPRRAVIGAILDLRTLLTDGDVAAVSVCVGVADHVVDPGLADALGLVTDTIADYLAVDTPTREVRHDAARAACHHSTTAGRASSVTAGRRTHDNDSRARS